MLFSRCIQRFPPLTSSTSTADALNLTISPTRLFVEREREREREREAERPLREHSQTQTIMEITDHFHKGRLSHSKRNVCPIQSGSSRTRVIGREPPSRRNLSETFSQAFKKATSFPTPPIPGFRFNSKKEFTTVTKIALTGFKRSEANR